MRWWIKRSVGLTNEIEPGEGFEADVDDFGHLAAGFQGQQQVNGTSAHIGRLLADKNVTKSLSDQFFL